MVKLQFRLSQEIPEEPNNLDHLHKLDMRGRQDENWVTRHAQWIEVWNNQHDLTLNGLPMLRPLQHTIEYMSWYISNSFLYLSIPQMLNDPRMHRASTSANVPPPQQTRHDFNTPPPPSGMEGRRNSISSNTELGIRSMFATYDETPPSAQPWLRTYPQSPNFLEGLDQPQEDSVYYVHNPYAEASSSVAHDDHQPQEEHEPQPSHVEEPRLEVRRRNPTRNRRRPRCGTGHHYGD